VISESFTDEYGTTITTRKLHDADTHVQLLLTYADRSEQTSYGFTEASFKRLAKQLLRTDEQIVAAKL
jgi:hypothetical protein